MAGSGLLVFLPLVGAILGAVVGGFVGAYANGRIRDREERKARERELKALLLLVDVEIWANDERLKACIDQGSFDPFAVAGLRTEDWDSSKAKLAELVGTSQFDTVVSRGVCKNCGR